MNKPARPTFHGFPVNTNLNLVEWDSIEALEWETILRVDRHMIDSHELQEKVRYIVSRNLVREINLRPGNNASFITCDGEIGIPPSKSASSKGDIPLYIILNRWFTELVGCTPVKELNFGYQHLMLKNRNIS